MSIANCSNCWELLMGQTAAKHSSKNEGSTTRSKDRTSKWMEMGRILMGLRYSLDLQATVSSFGKKRYKSNELI